MKKARSQALSTKKKAKSLTVSRVTRLKQTKKIKKANSLTVSKVTRLKQTKKIKKANSRKKKTVKTVIDLELERENWKKQRRDYWKRRFRRLVAN